MNLKNFLDEVYTLMGPATFPRRLRTVEAPLLQQVRSKVAGTGQLQLGLHGYLVLNPLNEEAEDFLNLMEADFDLPYTPTWRNEAGRKLRLYKTPEPFADVYSFTLQFEGLHLEVRMGSRDVYPIPEFRGDQPSSWLPHRSPLDLDPVILPPVTSFILVRLWLVQESLKYPNSLNN